MCKVAHLNQVQNTLLHWICEREEVRKAKERGAPKPWTSDRILRTYKFCNVRREDDRVTKWIHDNWLKPYKDHPNVSFAMCLARHFNWPDTLELLGFPDKWNPDEALDKLRAAKADGKKLYTGAYTVSTCGRAMEKIEYSVKLVLTPAYMHLRAPLADEPIENYWLELQKHEGFASFMAGQVVADLKFIDPLVYAPDWSNWAPLGPGSIRGLNRYFGRKLCYNVPQAQGLQELRAIQTTIKEQLGLDLALHNVQNCMCEYDKYIRLRDENGNVRSKYNGLT